MSNQNDKLNVSKEIHSLADQLIKELIKRKIVIASDNKYRIAKKGASATIEPGISPSFSTLFEFRNVVNNIYFDLFSAVTISSPIKLSQMLQKFESQGALKYHWKQNDHIVKTLDSLDSLATETGLHKVAANISKTINLNELTIALINFYAKRIISKFFINSGYVAPKSNQVQFDFVMYSDESHFSPLIFDIKLRKSNPSPDRDMLITALDSVSNLYKKGENNPHYFLVVFTFESEQRFEALRFRFRQLLNDFESQTAFSQNITFIPVSISGLPFLATQLETFKKGYIENKITTLFQAQPPPANFPSRNDHFFEEMFDFKKTEFEITVKPLDTKYWRFGFRFSKTSDFPFIAEDRHFNKSIVDIHLSVGDVIDGGSMVWAHENQLTLTVYHTTPVENKVNSLHNYTQTPVNIHLSSNLEGSVVIFNADTDNVLVATSIFDLREFNYCKIFAWADAIPFKIEAIIDLKIKRAF
jgi:hypothetical protein